MYDKQTRWAVETLVSNLHKMSGPDHRVEQIRNVFEHLRRAFPEQLIQPTIEDLIGMIGASGSDKAERWVEYVLAEIGKAFPSMIVKAEEVTTPRAEEKGIRFRLLQTMLPHVLEVAVSIHNAEFEPIGYVTATSDAGDPPRYRAAAWRKGWVSDRQIDHVSGRDGYFRSQLEAVGAILVEWESEKIGAIKGSTP